MPTPPITLRELLAAIARETENNPKLLDQPLLLGRNYQMASRLFVCTLLGQAREMGLPEGDFLQLIGAGGLENISLAE